MLHVSLPESYFERAKSKPTLRTQESFVFPVVLGCIALALILISAVFSPVTLETPGIESFLVGPEPPRLLAMLDL
jgi:hypothetical protein